MKKKVAVAIAILFQPDNHFLLAQRPKDKLYSGYWEFPGGKIEPNETPEKTVRRELQEELGINLKELSLWQQLLYQYPHADVNLHVFKVYEWSGKITNCEGQLFSWQSLPLTVKPVLPATELLINQLENTRK